MNKNIINIITEMVMNLKPPVRLRLMPGFDNEENLRWYVKKTIEITAKIIISDFREFSSSKNNDYE